jgi:hypothetical protein
MPEMARGVAAGAVLALALVAAVDVSAKRPAPINWQQLHRSFRPAQLPDCTVSPVLATLSDGRAIVGASQTGLMMVGEALPGEIRLGQAGSDGLRAQKTPWLVQSNFRGPLLIRAQPVDGQTASVRFAQVYGQSLPELRLRVAPARTNRLEVPSKTGARSFTFIPSTTAFSRPGCYAVQLDSPSFSGRIIVQVSQTN